MNKGNSSDDNSEKLGDETLEVLSLKSDTTEPEFLEEGLLEELFRENNIMATEAQVRRIMERAIGLANSALDVGLAAE